jgi:hypothetical protein
VSLVFAVYDACDANKRHPCFLQLDLTVRKILSGRPNPVPPFIILHSFNRTEAESIKAQILFTSDRAVPPQSIMQFWPNTCGGPQCPKPDCEPIQMPRDGKEKAWILDPLGELLSIVSWFTTCPSVSASIKILQETS